MKKLGIILLCMLLMSTFVLFALGSGSDDSGDGDQGSGSADNSTALGDYTVVIDSCRLAKDYEDKDVVIVKYVFTNNADEATSFDVAFIDHAYQDGIGLNGAYVLADSANFNDENQSKQIKTGATIEVEKAYVLNDLETDVEIEVEELFSFSDKVIKKTFSIK